MGHLLLVMRRISSRQDALLMELKELAKTQHEILKEVHPDVGGIKEHVVEEQGEKLNEIAAQVSHVEEAVASPQERKGGDNGQR
jgi:predicted AAA+ superfamily ATPase